MSEPAREQNAYPDAQTVRKLPARRLCVARISQTGEHGESSAEMHDHSAVALEGSWTEDALARDSEVPESFIREITPQMIEPVSAELVESREFVEEPTSIYWPPPVQHAVVDRRVKVQYGPVPQPPLMTFLRWLWLALAGS
jgi:hypothetical protein